MNGSITTTTWIHLSLRTTTLQLSPTSSQRIGPAHLQFLTFLSLPEFLPLSYPATWWPMPHETLQSCHGDGCQAQFVVRVQLLRKASHLLYRFGWYIYIYMYTVHIYIYIPSQSLKVALFTWPWWWGDYLPNEMDSKLSALRSRIIRTLSQNTLGNRSNSNENTLLAS